MWRIGGIVTGGGGCWNSSQVTAQEKDHNMKVTMVRGKWRRRTGSWMESWSWSPYEKYLELGLEILLVNIIAGEVESKATTDSIAEGGVEEEAKGSWENFGI